MEAKSSPKTAVNTLLSAAIQRCNSFIETLLPTNDIGLNKLNSAIRYAVLNGGKRLRPALVYATGEVLDIPAAKLDAAAASIELIHCYSLVHDDLPAMDNDDLRRGKPSCHKAFDEATAILAGDALQTLAFELLSNAELNPVPAEVRIDMVQILSKAAGANGMVLGQAQDMAASANRSIHSTPASAIDELVNMHRHKTGALFSAAISLALCCSDADQKTKAQICAYATNIGLGFQVADDILDVTTPTQILGKPAGSDQKLSKLTFPALLGLDRAQEYAKQCHRRAIDALAIFDAKADVLRDISAFFIERSY